MVNGGWARCSGHFTVLPTVLWFKDQVYPDDADPLVQQNAQ